MNKYDAMTLRKDKTDKIDSFKITNCGIDMWFRMVDYHASDKLYSELRILVSQCSYYLCMWVESKLVLSNMLD